MGSRLAAALVSAVSAIALPGCAFFGFLCEVYAPMVQQVHPDENFCSMFGGCCPLDAEGFWECGDLAGPFGLPCAQIHETDCVCAELDATRPTSALQTFDPRFAGYVEPPFTFGLGLEFAGFSPAHHVTFDVAADSWQTFSGAITYSSGFTFAGFTANGPAGTQIGTYGIDVDENDVVDFALPLRALTADTAFVDVNGDGQATVVDPTVTHVADVPTPGAHTFNLLLPAGGDAAPKVAFGFRAFRVHVVLSPGILGNPSAPGAYSVSGTFTSVDPDTGGASNGTGAAPQTVMIDPVAIGIDPSPIALVDHFLCYKTKASKGKICGASAAANAGGACTADADCGGTPGACGKNTLPKGLQPTVVDPLNQLASRTVAVKNPVQLCTPASTNGEDVHDTVTHLRGYAVG